MPLGMESGAISDSQISASSVHLGFLGLQRWAPELARLHRSGIVNAWTASNYDKNPWIQVRKEGVGWAESREGTGRDEVVCIWRGHHLGVHNWGPGSKVGGFPQVKVSKSGGAAWGRGSGVGGLDEEQAPGR